MRFHHHQSANSQTSREGVPTTSEPSQRFLCLSHHDIVSEDIFLGCPSVEPSAAFFSVRSFVRTDIVTTIPHRLNALNNFDIHWSLRMIRLDSEGQWLSGQGHSRPSRWRKHPRRFWGIKVHLLVWKCPTSDPWTPGQLHPVCTPD